ncbi:MAG TPA: DinB family protein [Candidatus Dormibacteraeota bacterium]|nr:DinB family protein [Candidatus Dormibacteraeota bacterium]
MRSSPETTRPIDPGTAAALIGAAGKAFETELTALPDLIASWHPAPGEWCVKEVVGHVVEAERRGFAGRIREILAADRPRLDTWDQVGVARQRGDCDRALADLLSELSRLRASSLELLTALRPEDLERGGDHVTVGYLTVRDLLHEWVHHDRNHLRQVLANVQAYVWPQMGNARRFSSG